MAAMATDGGLILYGLVRMHGALSELHPFPLAGEPERIDQIVQSSIAEPPTILIHSIQAEKPTGHGYIAVEIPASPRAPHMVIVGGDNRYYGRGATGNRILNEGDVARLYTRRDDWGRDARQFLEEVRTKQKPNPVVQSSGSSTSLRVR